MFTYKILKIVPHFIQASFRWVVVLLVLIMESFGEWACLFFQLRNICPTCCQYMEILPSRPACSINWERLVLLGILTHIYGEASFGWVVLVLLVLIMESFGEWASLFYQLRNICPTCPYIVISFKKSIQVKSSKFNMQLKFYDIIWRHTNQILH